jgi:hypothetical protein
MHTDLNDDDNQVVLCLIKHNSIKMYGELMKS